MKLKIGEKLLAIRQERQLSQEEMAELLAVSQSTYSRIEKSETSLEFDRVMQFAQALQVHFSELLPDVINMNNNATGPGSINFGGTNTYINIYGNEAAIQKLTEENARLRQEIDELRKNAK